MARDGSGSYSNPYPNFVNGTVISSDEADANNAAIATALTQSIAVDGQTTITANLPMNSKKFTGLAAGTAATDSLTLGQAQAQAFAWGGTAGGSADAITIAPTPAITAYAVGQKFFWIASGSANTGAATIAISGLTAIAMQDGGAALAAGVHAAGKVFMGVLNTTSTCQIMQVQSSGDPLVISGLTVNGTADITGTTTAVAITASGLVTAGAKIDMNGTELILDADADTSITADTDDTIDIRIAGADDFQFTANTFTSVSGSTIATNTIAETTAASGVTIDGLLIKDGAIPSINVIGNNLVQNGAMNVAQRGASFTSYGATNNAISLDRWGIEVRSSAPARWTATQESSGGVNGKEKWLKLLCTTADTTLAAGDAQTVYQTVEGHNAVALLGSDGFIAAHVISLDVIAHADGASSITFPAKVGVKIRTVDGTSRQYVTDITVAAADTWERVSIAIPADTVGTMDNDNGGAYLVNVSLYGEQTSSGGAWEANDAAEYVTANSDNLADATNNYIGFTLVQLEVGSVATTDFEHEDISTTLAKCQRYLRHLVSTTNTPVASGYASGTTTASFPVQFDPAMRAAPTFSVSAVGDFTVDMTGAARDTTGLVIAKATTYAARLDATVASGLVAGQAVQLAFDATGKTLTFTAEL